MAQVNINFREISGKNINDYRTEVTTESTDYEEHTSIQSIEEALDTDGVFTPETETVARNHIAEAKEYFGKKP